MLKGACLMNRPPQPFWHGSQMQRNQVLLRAIKKCRKKKPSACRFRYRHCRYCRLGIQPLKALPKLMNVHHCVAAATAPLNSITPATRLAAAAVFASATTALHTPAAILLALFAAMSLLPLCGLSTATILRRLAVGSIFLIFLWLTLPFTVPGPVAMSAGPLAVSAPGVRLALSATGKGLAIMAAFLALVAAMPVAAVGQGLRRLGVPAGLAAMLALSYRYIFVLAEEYKRLRMAATVRGFVPTTSLHTYRTFANLVGMVLVRSLDRAERLRQAMECRGFDGTFRLLGTHGAGRLDALALVLTLALAAALGAMEWGSWPAGAGG